MEPIGDSQGMDGITPELGWLGELTLTVKRGDRRTELARCYAKAPLKVQRAFYPEDDIAHLVLLHTAGGMVAGDRLTYDLCFEPDSHALITTAAAAKIYRSEGLTSTQSVQIRVGDGARAEWLPQDTILFDGCRYRQTLIVELGADATWLGWEITRFGRSARDEQFDQGDWTSDLQVSQAGRLLWVDRQAMAGEGDRWASPHGLGGWPVIGSLAYVGREVPTAVVAALRSAWVGEGETGVSRLQLGIVCRYRGRSRQDAQAWFQRVWVLLRQWDLDRPAVAPRVWQR
jgi:urease accessory protein